jgi:hypothetical protein
MRGAIQLLTIYLRERTFGDRFDCPAHGNQYVFDCDSCRVRIQAALNDAEVQQLCAVAGRSCSWCDHVNEVSPRPSLFCANCGHCAQVSRVECFCQRCQKGVA